jgi:hypothetical protein
MRVLTEDVRFLRACNIIDYSLVVAVHARGGRREASQVRDSL